MLEQLKSALVQIQRIEALHGVVTEVTGVRLADHESLAHTHYSNCSGMASTLNFLRVTSQLGSKGSIPTTGRI